MKTIPLLLLAAAATGFFPRPMMAADVTGSGHIVSETRGVSGFHGIDLRGSGRVIVTQGESEGLTIDAEDNILPLVESTVSDGILRLGLKSHHEGYIETHKDIVYHVQLKTLNRLTLEGSGNITADSLKTEVVDTTIDGSGEVKLGGEAHRGRVQINGSGSYAAKALKTGDAQVEINGSGEASVQADGSLAVEINGSGEVGYSGHPTVMKTVNGSGHVHPSDAKNDD